MELIRGKLLLSKLLCGRDAWEAALIVHLFIYCTIVTTQVKLIMPDMHRKSQKSLHGEPGLLA
jgi:hypothetical protein